MNQRIILLFGLPRSGTTWLGKILDSHPDTLYRHEPDSVRRIESVPLLPGEPSQGMLSQLREYCRDVRNNRVLKVAGKTPIFEKSYLSSLALLRYKLGIGIAQIASRAGVHVPVPGAPTNGDEGVTIVWKSIESLGRLGVLLQALPAARALHIVRHPCGSVASIERGEAGSRFGDISPASEDYQLLEMLLDTATGQSWGYSMADIRAMRPEERLAWRWAVFNDKALEETKDDKRVLMFAYERLCEAPLATARELIAHSGLEWSAQVERFIAASTGATDSRYYSVFKNPHKAAWSWQGAMEPAKAERIINLAARSKTWVALDYDHLAPGGPL